jgi:hypothetical protein
MFLNACYTRSITIAMFPRTSESSYVGCKTKEDPGRVAEMVLFLRRDRS